MVNPWKSHDAGDLHELLSSLLPKVRHWIFRMLGPSTFLDDVVQDALIEIARALPKFRGDSSLETFAYRISIRVAAKAIGKNTRRKAFLELLPPSPDQVDPRSRIADRELLRKLYAALDTLSTRKRAVFVLCEIEGFSPTEAAEILGGKASTIRSQLRRVRNQLASTLESDTDLAWFRERRQ